MIKFYIVHFRFWFIFFIIFHLNVTFLYVVKKCFINQISVILRYFPNIILRCVSGIIFQFYKLHFLLSVFLTTISFAFQFFLFRLTLDSIVVSFYWIKIRNSQKNSSRQRKQKQLRLTVQQMLRRGNGSCIYTLNNREEVPWKYEYNWFDKWLCKFWNDEFL